MNLPPVRVLGTDPIDAAQYRQLNLQLGLLSSALEHAEPEQLFTTDPAHPAEAVSAVKALAKANAAGQRLYHLTPSNLSETLPQLHHDEAVIEEIRTAVLHGREVITHTDAISVPGWSGAGYIILDPETGEGAYKIGGGQNGAYLLFGGALLLVIAIYLLPIVAGLLPAVMLSLGVYTFLVGVIENLDYFDWQESFDGVGLSLAIVGFAAFAAVISLTSAATSFLAVVSALIGIISYFASKL